MKFRNFGSHSKLILSSSGILIALELLFFYKLGMNKISAIVLAAGKGTRMKSSLPKVLHPLGGKALLHYPLSALEKFHCEKIVIVIGHQADEVKAATQGNSYLYALQEEQLGSGHAVLSAENALKDFEGSCFILSGDAPLITSESLTKLLEHHEKNQNALTLASFKTPNPKGYGRIIRDAQNHFSKIVEESDLQNEEAKIEEVNGGLYLARCPLLFEMLKKIKKNPNKGEYYLTDLPALLMAQNEKVGVFEMNNAKELQGVNSKLELSQAEYEMQKRIREKWMLAGVSMQNPESIYIEEGVELDADVTLEAQVRLEGKTKIVSGSRIHQGAILKDSFLAENVEIKPYCFIQEAHIEANASVGPFAHLRPGTHLGKKSKVGNFVEIKKTKLGEGSKASHLSYLGDAIIGKNVNIGAGTITCNYDGKNKFETILEDDVFVGSDTQFVAPVKVGKGATIGAGTTVTKEVPEGALAVSRLEQKNIEAYSLKKKR